MAAIHGRFGEDNSANLIFDKRARFCYPIIYPTGVAYKARR